jgi:hypothetical protein
VVISQEMTAFLESGCGLIIGLPSADGAPIASRGWGLTVVADGPEGDDHLRLLVGTSDERPVRQMRPGTSIAVTGSDVRTLQSVQVKGRILSVVAAEDADRARAQRYCDDFLGVVAEIDHLPRSLLARLVPDEYLACVITLDELFDQTPGPRAGSHIPAMRR